MSLKVLGNISHSWELILILYDNLIGVISARIFTADSMIVFAYSIGIQWGIQ